MSRMLVLFYFELISTRGVIHEAYTKVTANQVAAKASFRILIISLFVSVQLTKPNERMSSPQQVQVTKTQQCAKISHCE